jgi:hypothetical protein
MLNERKNYVPYQYISSFVEKVFRSDKYLESYAGDALKDAAKSFR